MMTLAKSSIFTKKCIFGLALLCSPAIIYLILILASKNTFFNDSSRWEALPTCNQSKTFDFSHWKDLEFSSTVQPMVRHGEPIVPNIVHFIKFGSTEILFTELVNYLAVLVNHKPDIIMIHCSLCVNNVTMGGKYWDQFMERNPPVQVRHYPEPTHIFGQQLSSTYHASDVARILIMKEHGGIYMDNDVYVVNPLDHFRNYEMTLGWPTNQGMGSMLLIAHPNARFLKLWLDSYHIYNGSLWYHNAGDHPTKVYLEPKPYLVHRVSKLFGEHMMIGELYQTVWPEWMDYYAIHTLIRHRSYLDKESPIRDFNESNIRQYNRTFGQMARLVIFNTTELV